MEDSKRTTRRRHATDLKARVLCECAEPGASVAQVALAHGLNANLVHKWRRQAHSGIVAAVPMRESGAFMPLALAPELTPPAGEIRIELRRGPIAVNVTWPVASATHCAAWLREVLK
jgi:transposase